MIPKKNRFTTKLFEKNFSKSRRFRKGNFEMLISQSPAEEHWSVVVGKKVSKLAVRRNRIRRQLYEIIRQHFLGKFPRKNVICLYKGGQKLDNLQEFKKAIHDIIAESLDNKKPSIKN